MLGISARVFPVLQPKKRQLTPMVRQFIMYGCSRYVISLEKFKNLKWRRFGDDAKKSGFLRVKSKNGRPLNIVKMDIHSISAGAPGRDRTCDTRIRNLLFLIPLSVKKYHIASRILILSALPQKGLYILFFKVTYFPYSFYLKWRSLGDLMATISL